MASAIRIAILANASQAKKEIDGTRSKLAGFGSGLKSLAATAGVAFGGAAVIQGVKSIVKAASDAQQSIGATESVFGRYASSVVRDSNRAASAVGLSANEYRENANVLGSLLKNQGVAADELAGKTKGLIKVGADLSATFGGSTREAVEALASAYKGEFDPLERYGISIKQSTINTEAARIAQEQYGKALSALSPTQQRAIQQQATSNLITKQSASSRNAFARETGTLAHQQQVLAAKFENVKAMLGSALLPVLTRVFSYLASTVVPAMTRFIAQMRNGTGAGGVFAAILRTIGGVLSTVGGFLANHAKLVATIVAAYAAWRTITAIINAVRVAQVAYTAVTYGAAGATYASGAALGIYNAVMKAAAIGSRVFAIAQGALNLVMAANPIVLVVIAIAALVAAFVLAYKHCETFRNIVNAVFSAIRTIVVGAVTAVVGFVRDHWRLLIAIIAGPLGIVVGFVISHWNAIKAATAAAWNAIKFAVTHPVEAVKATVSSAVAGVRGAVSAAWSFVQSATSRVWNGLRGAVSSAISAVLGIVHGLRSRIIGVFAGAGSWLVSAGRSIIEGLINGITAMAGKVKSAVGSVLKGARNLLPFSPAKEGPFSGKGWTVYSGRSISEGLAEGITDRTQTVRRAAEVLAQSAIPAVTDLRDALDGSLDARTALRLTTTAKPAPIPIVLSAEALTSLQRGKSIQADLDAYAAAGGRRRS